MKLKTTLFSLALSVAHLFGQTSHGVPLAAYPSYPLWQEQALLVATNMVRMAPAAFRDTYMSPAYTILLPQNYPAVNPVFWNIDLNRSSRFYALDMANNCGWRDNHLSCDSTPWDVRIKSFYTASGWLSENKATGNIAPQQMLIQLLKDSVKSLQAPAPDKSANDGHRQNIMSANYKEMGNGYAYSSTKIWYHFWVQDFGGGVNTMASRPIVAGSHLFLTNNQTTFMVNYYEPGGGSPQSASVVVGGVSYAMTLHLGTASRGSYSKALTKATVCRNYYFSFKDSKGATWLYPEKGAFSTYGEGSCLTYYLPPESLSTEVAFAPTSPLLSEVHASMNNKTLSLYFPDATTSPLMETRVYTPAGRLVHHHFWGALMLQPRQLLILELSNKLSPGVYIVLNRYQDGRPETAKSLYLP